MLVLKLVLLEGGRAQVIPLPLQVHAPLQVLTLMQELTQLQVLRQVQVLTQLQVLRQLHVLRYAIMKNRGLFRIFFFFWGGGGLPNSQNPKPKKCPFITLKSPRKHTKMFTKPPISFNKGFPKEAMRYPVQQQHRVSSNTVLAATFVQQHYQFSSKTSLAAVQVQQQYQFSSSTSLAAIPVQQQNSVSTNASLTATPGYAVRTICLPYDLSTPNQGSPYNLSPYGLSAVRTICHPYGLSADQKQHPEVNRRFTQDEDAQEQEKE